MSEQVKINLISPDGKEYSCWTYAGKNLWEAITLNGIDFGASCGGKGSCGKCKVRIEGDFSEPGSGEREHLLAEEIKNGYRLACYYTVKEPMKVFLDFNGLSLDAKSSLHRDLPALAAKTPVSSKQVFIPGIDSYNPIPIHRRLANALPAYRLDLTTSNLNELSRLDRPGRPSIELYALIFDNQTVKYIGRKKSGAYGVALDLGTTSLFAALLDLESGKTLALSSKSNMQRVYGADLISRVNYCLENPDGLEKLQQILLNNINSMIGEMLEENGASVQKIYRFAVAANPVILHLFMGLRPGGFAEAPYVGLFTDEIQYPAADLGLEANRDAELFILPQVGGFVGADTIACLLNLPVDNSSSYLLIDIGTNGEIVLNKRGKMWAASAAAGPAFEGGGISSGMRADSGAIDKVYLRDDGKLEFNVLGDKPLKGLCGSAIIDITACLLKAKYMDSNGTLNTETLDHLQIRQAERGMEIVLPNDGDDINISPVVFNQEDIRQVQLAKGAIRTAIDILLQEADMEYEDLQKVFLAGAFGNYLDPENSMVIGLLPAVDRNIITNIGNAAGQGTIAALLSEDKRREARALKEKITYIELAQHPSFQEIFLKNLNF